MKKLLSYTLLAALSLCVTGCYEDYVKDYEYSGIYLAYQYDLRSFVVGEGMEFEVGPVLGGVMRNTHDRKVWCAFDDALVTENLRAFVPGAETDFTAFTEMSGQTSVGAVSQDYVKTAIAASKIEALTPLPQDAINVPDNPVLTIAKGMHTATVKVKADSAAFLSLPGAGPKPYYAIGIQILSADVDTVLLSKSYEVIALRYENTLFGNWYHGGRRAIVDASGAEVSAVVYPTEIPSDEGSQAVYSLQTASPHSVSTNYMADGAGSLEITLKDGAVSVQSLGSTPVTDLGSSFNNSKLLQDRKIFLNYSYDNADGTKTVVKDTLTFRNRIRDGVSEWQDTNPEHYK